MIKQLPQAVITHEQFNDAFEHAQLRACRAARAHSPQPTITSRLRLKYAAHFRQDSDGHRHQRKHLRPCFEATQAFRVTKAFFTGEAPRVLLRHPISRQVAVRQQVPDAPPPVLIARSRLHQKKVSRVVRRVPDSSPCPSALILRPAQGVENAPSVFDPHRVVRFGADHIRNTKFIEQIEQSDIGEPSVCRQYKASPGHATQNIGKECTDELALIHAHPPF